MVLVFHKAFRSPPLSFFYSALEEVLGSICDSPSNERKEEREERTVLRLQRKELRWISQETKSLLTNDPL
jgi:hypothetical protein